MREHIETHLHGDLGQIDLSQRVRDFQSCKKGLRDPSPPEIRCPVYLVPVIHLWNYKYSAGLNISSKYLEKHHLGFSFLISLSFLSPHSADVPVWKEWAGPHPQPSLSACLTFRSKMLTPNWGSIFSFLFHCRVWYVSVILPRWAQQSHSAFNSTRILHWGATLWTLLLSFPPPAISGILLIRSALLSCCSTEEPTQVCRSLWRRRVKRFL